MADVKQPGAMGIGIVDDRRAIPGQIPRRRPGETGQQAQQARLTAAVGAAQHQGLPGIEGEAEPLED